MKIVHIITGLERGGAEGALLRLCLATQGEGLQHTVVSLKGPGVHADTLMHAGINVVCFGMTSLSSVFAAVRQLVRFLRSENPDVVQTWLYHADLIGGICARIAGIRAVVWGVRNSAPDTSSVKKSTRAVIRACALLSRMVPAKIIVCAHNAIGAHLAIGYRERKMVVINNGIDLAHFRPAQVQRDEWRTEMGLTSGAPVVGTVARFAAQKDHLSLLRALAELVSRKVRFQCVLVGDGTDATNSVLGRWIESLGLAGHITLVGARTDMPAVMNALDLHILPSRIEGFPNVLAEAMACGTPCVSTDVGDADRIVAGHGWIVPKQNEVALADAICDALKECREFPELWAQRQARCRAHIEEEFGMERMIREYRTVWRDAASLHPSARSCFHESA